MADKYCRLVSFLVNICPEPLRELFTEQAKADQGTAYTTLASYLGFKRAQIEQLIKKNKLTEDQIDLLFPNPGSDPAEVSQWDISLLSLLITEFIGKTHAHNKIRYFISEIRDVRNSLQHTSNTRSMSDPDFNDTWQRLETATLFLANLHGTAYECRIKKEIEDAKFKNMPDLGNTLCLWFEEKITQIQNNVEEISSNTKDIQATAREGTAILRSAAVKKQGPSGEKVKRLKTVDIKLKTMQDNFERTMNSDIPDNFDAPPEVDKIKTKLRDNHLVIVAGHNSSHYLAAALSAIKDMSYIEKRCAELQRSSDWSHIDPEDVDFVLCCHPFGNWVYNEEKAKGMADIFNSIQHTVKEEEDDNNLAVLIVTDIGVLDECKEKHYHNILEEVVSVYHSTSEAQPADLTGECIKSSLSTSALTKNLTELTGLFLDHHKRQVHPDILKAAKTKIKTHKVVVLIGPPGSGKTSLAVALADSYHPSKVLLLTYPEQVQHIDLLRINLVVIEDFVGKYDYNKANICNWFKTFDLLHVLKSAGKLNVIITCDKQKLEKCSEEIATHPLLEHTVELLSQSVIIKQEISNTEVPLQRQHITQQPLQSHVVPTTVSDSSHSEHHSKSSSFPQPQPANADTQAAQSQTAQAHSTQPQLPADYMTSPLLTTSNTRYYGSRESKVIQENEPKSEVSFDQHQPPSYQQQQQKIFSQQQHEVKQQQQQQTSMSQQQDLYLQQHLYQQQQAMLQSQKEKVQQEPSRRHIPQKSMYTGQQQQIVMPNKSVSHYGPQYVGYNFYVQQGQNRPVATQQQYLMNSNNYPIEEEIEQQFLQTQKETEEDNKQLDPYGLPSVYALTSTQSEFYSQQQIFNNCDHMGSMRVQGSANQSDPGARNWQMLTQSQGDPTQRKVDINLPDSNGVFQTNQNQRISQGEQGNEKAVSELGQSLLSQTQQRPQMQKINKHNVVLEGGGQFEEGQAYVLRDRYGSARTMVWRNDEFHPYVHRSREVSTQQAHFNVEST